jgi:hypothetical protein
MCTQITNNDLLTSFPGQVHTNQQQRFVNIASGAITWK